MTYLPIPVNSFIRFHGTSDLSNLFKYQKTVDFRESHTNCEHPIKQYIFKPGDGSPEIITTQPKFDYFYLKPGLYYVTGTVVGACPCHNAQTITKPVLVNDDDLAVKKHYGKDIWSIISLLFQLLGFITIIKDIMTIEHANQKHFLIRTS